MHRNQLPADYTPQHTGPRFVLVDGKARLEVPDGYVWTASSLARVVKTLLGPKARIWNRPGRVTVGFQVGPNKIRLGGGQSPSEAFLATFAKPAEAMAREGAQSPA